MAVKLVISSSNPTSFATLVIAEAVKSVVSIDNIKLDGQSTSVTSASGVLISGPLAAGRYLCRAADQLYTGSSLKKSEIDHWLEFSVNTLGQVSRCIEGLGVLENMLALRSYLVGHSFSLADIAVYAALRGKQQWKTATYPKLSRWFTLVDSEHSVQAAEKQWPNKQTEKSEDVGKFMELPGATEGNVVVRFPPEASGYLHIGHAKAALLNQHYQQAFKGKLLMRFDDTNPAKENRHFEKIILQDLELLEIKPDSFSRTSDHFDLIMEKCEWMIRQEKAYADNTPSEEMKSQREERIPSKCRDNSVETSLAMWEEMKNGTELGQTYCIRAKIDMASDNGCLRDPTMYRCRSEVHVETGSKYKVYPTYDFACPIVDSVEGVTHALRTTEYNDRDIQYNWFIDTLGIRKPFIWGYSRLNLQHTVLSKRKLTWFVSEGLVEGWDDPRFPTVKGVLRRGMTVEGLKQFIVAQGSSRSVVMMDWDKLWSFNRKVIDPIVPRYTALLKNDMVPIDLEGATDATKTCNKHPKNSSVGTKTVHYASQVWLEGADAANLKEGQTITLINWGNVVITDIDRLPSGVVTKVKGKLNLDNTSFAGTAKLTWLADKNTTPTILVHFEHLISKAILKPTDDFKDYINHNTKEEHTMLGDPCLRDLKNGDIIQLQRRGFYICDRPYVPPSPYSSLGELPCILFNIPDGKQAVLPSEPKSPQKVPRVQKTSQQGTPPTVPVVAAAAAGDDVDTLKKQIEQVGNQIRQMKATGADKAVIDNEVTVLLCLKEQYAQLTGEIVVTKNKKPKKQQEKQPEQPENIGQKQKQTRLGLEAKKETQLSDWYSQVITKAELIEYHDVSGCYVLRPSSYSIWEKIKDYFDKKIKNLGVENVYFPIFVSKAALEREKTHIADFAPEVAWVTKSGNTDLKEAIAIRPTSETVMYPAYANWIRSHRDLPLKLNQWCNIVRWEFKHPQPFLRTREFLWQEGHTAHANKDDAVKEVYQILEFYVGVYKDLLAIPVVRGRKTEKEKFAGGDFTTTIEAFVSASGRGIQAATSHHLGQNFSKMFEIMFEDPDQEGKHLFVYQNSWGITTRTIGILVMVHGDNKGLVLPPRVASKQVVIVPCGVTPLNFKDVVKKCEEVADMLRIQGDFRVTVDTRDNYSVGWKFNHWELKGVPLRVEIGPQDIKKEQFVAASRDTGEKVVLKLSEAVPAITGLLEDIQNRLYDKAKKELDDHIVYTDNWEMFCSSLDEKKLIISPYCGEVTCEDAIKKQSASVEVEAGAPAMGAKALCIPEDPYYTRNISSDAKCIRPKCTNKANYYTLFGRSY
ncbi:bifunctional glutamate/proline--tRNA ligase-like isoform X2 [Dysidea avara]|uniref:bifunctional glutamate/proline--tRNA ligase-like isoform X2 n=1 Tax=Dysidea avara TaxID=196820 RepID=UPI00331823C4